MKLVDYEIVSTTTGTFVRCRLKPKANKSPICGWASPVRGVFPKKVVVDCSFLLAAQIPGDNESAGDR